MKIVKYPNPILTKPAKDINLSNLNLKQLKRLKQLTKQMTKTMYQHDGIGLAAPQIGQNLRLCIIGKKTGDLEEDLILINPLVIERSVETSILEEGCLSLPKVKIDVERPVWIKVRTSDFDGGSFKLEAHDLLARVIQHEIDHLDGILIIDK